MAKKGTFRSKKGAHKDPPRPDESLDVELEGCLDHFPDLVWGHKWMFVYDPSAAPGTPEAYVDVSIVMWNKVTYDLATEVSNYRRIYPVKFTSSGANTIEFALDIKRNIDETYQYFRLKMRAPSEENYPAFAIETIGHWAAPGHGVSAAHDSFKYKIRRKPGSNDVSFDADFIGKTGRGAITVSGSDPVTPTLNQTYGMGLHLDYWLSIHENPTSGDRAKVKAIDYYYWSKNRSADKIFLNRSSLSDVKNGVRFRLLPSTLELTIDPNFRLEKYIVDPKGFGSGGNGM